MSSSAVSTIASKTSAVASKASNMTSQLASTPSKLATPTKGTPTKLAAPFPVTDSPGNWKHPRLAEITRRQRKTEFGQRNLNSIAYNVGALIFLVVLRQTVASKIPTGWLSADTKSYISWTYLACQLIPVFNIILALLPLVRQQDDLSDIPLTTAQRKLLGLPPSSAPPTPNSTIATPPRYSRTPSLAGSATSNRSYNSSPLSANGGGSPASDRRPSGSPVMTGSPLFQRAVANGMNAGRRSSFGSPSAAGLGVSTGTSLFGGGDAPGTPTPAQGGKKSSVGLNNKWLYDRGKRSGNSPLY